MKNEEKMERYIDFVELPLQLIEEIMNGYDTSLTISSYTGIDYGRANSNYIIDTNKGQMVLRVCRNKAVYDNEIIIDSKLDVSIRRPKLLYHTIHQDIPYLLYKYIESDSLGKYSVITDDIVKQVSVLSAFIHNTPVEKVNDITKLDLPPFTTWYEHFLDNPNTVKRLGTDIQKRLKYIIQQCSEELSIIDSFHTVIHNDFRVDNIIVDNHNDVFITDWEGLMVNHRLADIGQFFRYCNRFSSKQFDIFEHYYNKEAIVPLPDDWFKLSRLRDLVNLLQLISIDKNLPNYYNEVYSLISDTLEYFESIKG